MPDPASRPLQPEVRTRDPSAAKSPGSRPDAAPARTPQHPIEIKSYRDVTYCTIPGFRPLLLDLHVPLAPAGRSPVVLYAHGGGFIGGSKEGGPWQFLLSAGYAVVSVSYRLREEATFPGPVHDVKAATRWIRAHG